MTRRTWTTAVLVAGMAATAAVMGVVGCGGGKEEARETASRPAGQEAKGTGPAGTAGAQTKAATTGPASAGSGAATPKEAVVNVAKAIEGENKALFLANVYCEDAELAEAIFAISVVTRDLTRDFEQHYGREKWGPFRTRRLPGPAEVAETVRVEVNGDRARAIVPDQGAITVLVRRDGGWREDLVEEIATSGDNPQAAKLYAGRVVRSMRKARSKIGIGAYKDAPEKLLDELLKDLRGEGEAAVPGEEEPKKEQDKDKDKEREGEKDKGMDGFPGTL